LIFWRSGWNVDVAILKCERLKWPVTALPPTSR
jgi:hypothetical protein